MTNSLAPNSTFACSQGLPISLRSLIAVMMLTLLVSASGLVAQQPPTTKSMLPLATKKLSSPADEPPQAGFETANPQKSSIETGVTPETRSTNTGLTPPSPAIQDAGAAEMDPAILKEIQAIRARLGGGVAEQLEGLLDRPAATQITKPTERRNAGRLMLEHVFNEEIKQLAGLQPPAPTRPESSAAGNTSVSYRLRMAARYLDLAAAELEEVPEFVDADQLRQKAHLLRLKAR